MARLLKYIIVNVNMRNMAKYNYLEEINSAGNCFFIRWYNTHGNEFSIEICEDEEYEHCLESYCIDINTKDEWPKSLSDAWINQEICNSVRSTIEYL